MKKIILKEGKTSLDNIQVRDVNLNNGGNFDLSLKFFSYGIVLNDIGDGTRKILCIKNGVPHVLPWEYGDKYKFSNKNYKRGLCIGNSITLHPINDYWWGLWGMASTKREKDYVHRLEYKIQQDNPDFTMDACNLAEWERDFTINLDLTAISFAANSQGENITADVRDYSHIFIRIGENVQDVNSFQLALEKLISKIFELNPYVTLCITGTFWADSTKENIISLVAAEFDIPYIQINDLDTDTYKERVGNQVYGDDGQWHTIDNQGVANHPNDAGMEAIAQRIYNIL